MDPTQTDPSLLANGILSPLTSGNYVTPEQVQRMRLYADSLRNNVNTMPVKSGWQGLAQMANAGLSGLIDNQANQQQRQLLQQEADQKNVGIYSQFPGMSGATQPNQSAPQPNQSATAQGDYPNTPEGHDAFNMAYAASQGVDPNLVHNLTASEGLYAKGANRPSTVDIDKDGNPFSFTDFQLNVHKGALGASARAAGIDPADPNQWQAANKFAIDYMKNNDLQPWKGDKAVEAYRASTGQKDYATPRVPISQQAQAPAQAPVQVAQASPPPIPGGANSFSGMEPGQGPAPVGRGGIGGAPAVGAINNAMPPAQPNAPPQDPRIQALRSGGAPPPMNSALLARALAGLSPQDVEMAMKIYGPQIVQGPMGTSFVQSLYGANQGAAPRMFANQGAVSTLKGPNGRETPMFTRMDPANNTITTNAVVPNSTINLGPQPTPGSTTPPGQTQPPSPTTTAPPTDPLEYKKNGTYGDLQRTQAIQEAYDKTTSDQAVGENKRVLQAGINLQQSQGVAQQLSIYKAHLQHMADLGMTNVFGPLGPSLEKATGIANQLGLAGTDYKDALATVQEMQKVSKSIVLTRLASMDLGHETDSLRDTIAKSNVNPEISFQGQVDIADTQDRLNQLQMLHDQTMQKYAGKHLGFLHDPNNPQDTFDNGWNKAIRGEKTNDPIFADVHPQILSAIPASVDRASDGKGWLADLPSTDAKGYRRVYMTNKPDYVK